MKSLLAMMFLASSLSMASEVKYPDQEFADFSPKLKERLLKIRSLLERNKTCEVAIYSASKAVLKVFYTPDSVQCIANMVVAEGSINEKTGCAFVNFDVNNAQVTFGRGTPSQPIVSKLCADGGIQELMQLEGREARGANPAPTIEELLFHYSPAIYSYVLVYANSEKYVTWFSEARKKNAELVTKKIKLQAEKEKVAEEQQLKAENEEKAREAARKKKDADKKSKKEALWK